MPESDTTTASPSESPLPESQRGRWPLHWPSVDGLKATLVYGSGIFLLWLVVYGGSNWIVGLHSYRVAIDTRLDAVVPFVPGAAIVYVSLFAMLGIAPFVLASRRQFQKLAAELCVAIL